MKLFVIIIILFSAACNDTANRTIVAVKPLNSKDTTITLKDTLGDAAVTLRIWLPLSIIIFRNFITAYTIVAWLCRVPNLLVANLITRRLKANDINCNQHWRYFGG